MTLIPFLVTLFVTVLIELLYFKLAEKLNIIDKPNHRSSHTIVTIRGGGIIFALALILYPIYFGTGYRYFLLGLFAVAAISFADDIKPVSSTIRILFHIFAVSLMFFQLGLFNFPIYWVILAFFLVIASINAINFMDGINGITGSYSFITLSTLLYINCYVTKFVVPSFLMVTIIAVLVFNFFNFRLKAKCFAGDVGSVSIAFIILFFMLELIIKTENLTYLLLLLLYGLDTASTIGFRIIRKEKISEPHRSHFYQFLANEKNIPHILVSSIYAIVQLGINLILIIFIPSSVLILLLSLLCSGVIFIVLRFSLEGSSKLLGERILS